MDLRCCGLNKCTFIYYLRMRMRTTLHNVVLPKADVIYYEVLSDAKLNLHSRIILAEDKVYAMLMPRPYIKIKCYIHGHTDDPAHFQYSG